jgi:hypothetical protein
MIKEYFFPTIIYIKDLPNANELNLYLEKQIIQWSNQDKGISKTNVNGRIIPNAKRNYSRRIFRHGT